MADVDDIDPFGDHDKPDDHPDETGKNIPLIPGGAMAGPPLEPDCKQEILFRGTDAFSLLEYHIEELYHVLSEDLNQYPEYLHLYKYKFELRNVELYFKGKDEPLRTKKGMLRSVGQIKCIFKCITAHIC